MLEINNIDVAYGKAKILHGLSLTAKPGEILCLLGRNGAGKTTTMQAIMGLLRLKAGSISLAGEDLSKLPAHEVPRRGIGYVPQGRRLFSELTVAENIEIGLMVRGKGDETRNRVLDIFPRLRERLDQAAETLSGGEQQMLATARALCIEPSVLLLDEPTEGLQPSMIEQIRQVIVRMKAEGVAVILVEQRVDAVLSIADRVAFIENGRNREIVDASVLRDDHTLLTKYVGV
jgi:branched-chain amino acid transport system ATP-binding protein